ncbi:MAG: DUF1592 domain-containing protein [Opitutaceae bacterium]
MSYRPPLLPYFKPPALGSSIALFSLLASAMFAAEAPSKSSDPPALAPAAFNNDVALVEFEKIVSPILQKNCYECHGDGAKKGGIAFDQLKPKDIVQSPDLWLKVLRNTRSQVMPPAGEPMPSAAEQLALEKWIKTGAFHLDPSQPDPGRVTIRRLNRTEYRNTIRDLIGLEFDADSALPPDDVGYGFDNIGDVMSISPMRTEKFIEAALAVVNKGVPLDTVVMTTRFTDGADYLSNNELRAPYGKSGAKMSYYERQQASHRYKIEKAGEYRITLNTKLDGEAQPVDPQQVKVLWTADGKEILKTVYKYSDADYPRTEIVVNWEAGEHEIKVEVEPVFPELQPLRTKMEYRVLWVDVDGPLEKAKWDHHPNYARFYPRDRPPEAAADRRVYAREVIGSFASKAYRRPVEPEVVEELVGIAEKVYSISGNTFEKGIAQAFVAVLASPRFLFNLEYTTPVAGRNVGQLDEYSLAARLSYALWSSLPDPELTQLAARGELRKNFPAQVKRMLADPKAQAFSENFAGQWLQARGVIDIAINSTAVMATEAMPLSAAPPAPAAAPVATAIPPAAAPAGIIPDPSAPAAGNLAVVPPGGRGRGAGPGAGRGGFAGAGRGGRGGPTIALGSELTPEIRTAMKQEAESYFHHIVQENRSVLELLNSNYTFVNEPLAAVYGLPNVTGNQMRRVELPADSIRGGVLTMGSTLTITSNPTRTSPVKRGKWILENILGAPPPPPPPDVPALEESKVQGEQKAPTQRELLALHRASPLCASCHERMDPLGLAMEGFNAFGRQRTHEAGQPIDPAGELATGEKFTNVRELKQALINRHRSEFYHTITEKLMTYILGRGVEYYDIPTIDGIVQRLEQDKGQFSTLLMGVLDSPAFHQRRLAPKAANQETKSVVLNSPTSLSP